MQARFTAAREHARYGRRLARRTAAAAAAARRTAAAADVTVVPETANEAPPPCRGGVTGHVLLQLFQVTLLRDPSMRS